MTKLNFRKKMFSSAVLIFAAATTFAGFWDWSTPYRGPSKEIRTLIVTANYKKPLLLAQLIQHETRQPYILLPARKQHAIFFCPVNQNKPALQIKEKNLARFIHFTNPKQIIVLGDNTYVPQKYIKLIDKKIPVIIIQGGDWIRDTETLAKMLDLSNLPYDYKRLYRKLDSGNLYRPSKSQAPEKTVVKEIVISEENVVAKETDKKADTPAKAAPVKEPEVKLPQNAPELVKDSK